MKHDVTTGVAETTLGVTGADVEAALQTDALADAFEKTVYGDGQTSLYARCGMVEVHTIGAELVRLDLLGRDAPGVKGRGWRTAYITRAQLRTLRDGADVLLRATATSGEVAS